MSALSEVGAAERWLKRCAKGVTRANLDASPEGMVRWERAKSRLVDAGIRYGVALELLRKHIQKRVRP